jgi:hypothetical protein
MTRRRLAAVTFGLIAALIVVALLVPLPTALDVAVFVFVVLLVGIWFFRFSPYGDAWVTADELGVNPWWIVVLVFAFGAAVFVLRLALIDAA